MKNINQIIFLIMVLLIISGCTNQEPIDGKVSFVVQERLENLVDEELVSLRNNNGVTITSKELSPLANAFLRTIEPTHQVSELPLTKYLLLSYKLEDENIKLFLPNSINENPQKNIYLQGYDDQEVIYYRLEAGEKETLDLIEHFNKEK
jgi:hypothetical protein